VSEIPSEILGFGSAALAPQQNPTFTPGADFTTEDYFLFSRCDGRTTAKAIIQMVGLGNEKGCAIMAKLRRLGAILLPGETPESLAKAAADPGSGRRTPETLRPRPPDTARPRPGTSAPPDTRDLERPIALGTLTPTEAAAMAEPVALTERERQRIIEMSRLCERGTLYDLLGVLPTADKKELKRAYFRLSKEFHPDRYYNKAVGAFGPWLTAIFQKISSAFEVLSDERQRGAYAARLHGDSSPPPTTAAQSRTEHARELFERACALEVQGQLAEAVKLFAAALRVDPLPRFLRRAAVCCIAAGELEQAEKYARKAAELRPTDGSYARVLAEVLRKADKLEDAERILVAAIERGSENDVVHRELGADLAAVRAARTSR
jgi:hypothetical protein